MKSLTLILMASSGLLGSEFGLLEPYEINYKPSIGSALVEEDVKDNGRTFAASVQSHGLELSYTMWTDWSIPLAKSDRIDEVNLNYIYSIDWFRIGIGGRYYGDIGGDHLQKGFHSIIGQATKEIVMDNTYKLERYDGVAYIGFNKYWRGNDISEFKVGITAYNDISTYGEYNNYGFMGLVFNHVIVGMNWKYNFNSPSEVKRNWEHGETGENRIGTTLGFYNKYLISDIVITNTLDYHYRIGLRF